MEPIAPAIRTQLFCQMGPSVGIDLGAITLDIHTRSFPEPLFGRSEASTHDPVADEMAGIVQNSDWPTLRPILRPTSGLLF